jgi:hypothetical protein
MKNVKMDKKIAGNRPETRDKRKSSRFLVPQRAVVLGS